jgi:uncharacterized protein (TIGR03435 family)
LDTPRGEIAIANPNAIGSPFTDAVEPFGLKLERRNVVTDFIVVDRVNLSPLEN